MADGQIFTAYLTAAQDRLREMFVRGLMENEHIVDSRLFAPDDSIRAQAIIPPEDEIQGKLVSMLLSSHEGGEKRNRVILSREGYVDAFCIDCTDFPTAFCICASMLTR